MRRIPERVIDLLSRGPDGDRVQIAGDYLVAGGLAVRGYERATALGVVCTLFAVSKGPDCELRDGAYLRACAQDGTLCAVTLAGLVHAVDGRLYLRDPRVAGAASAAGGAR